MMGDHSLVQLLLDRGADRRLCNERGDSPADLARVNGAMAVLYDRMASAMASWWGDPKVGV